MINYYHLIGSMLVGSTGYMTFVILLAHTSDSEEFVNSSAIQPFIFGAFIGLGLYLLTV